ncbi:MAG TPA: GGDEF domain-containing protein [Myxococcota bacterium]|nr:GGDEF domain-containing protein [Myxococcota bacterium]
MLEAGRDAPHVTLIALEGGRAAAGAESCLVQIYGPRVGRRFALDRPELVIGRDAGCELPVALDTVSRRHARIAMRAGTALVSDLGSTNGTFLNDQALAPDEELPLRSGDAIRVGGAIFRFLCGGDLEALYLEEVHRAMVFDGLTGAHTSRHFADFLEREMARCQRHDRPLSLVAFEIDAFERVNEDFGHLTGDAVLRQLAALVGSRVRREDCFARRGGDSFAIALPENDLDAARIFAERLRRLVADREFRAGGERIPVTLSVGVASLSKEMQEPAQFAKAADARLAEARGRGGNQVA